MFVVTSGAAPVAAHSGAGLATNFDFARLVLRDGGWPVSADNVTVLTQWLRAEEPVDDWWNRDNPLNNGLGSGGGDGTGSYRSVVVAAVDVARNLVQNAAYGYPAIVRDLEASAPPSVTAAAIWRSSWAAGHYGRGADWGTSPVPSVASPPAAWSSPTACPIAYPPGEVGPCSAAFTTSGTSWRSGAPEGIEGQELYAFASGATGQDTAVWAPTLAEGRYAVSVFVPAQFADATVSYVVVDARGGHRVVVDQEPYANAWVPLGVFTSTPASSVRVQLSTVSLDARGATFVAADAVRFEPASADALGATHPPLTTAAGHLVAPGPPQSVSAVGSDRHVTVSWLAPSKDGGASIERYVVVATPGGHACAQLARLPLPDSCAVGGLTNGVAYTFHVRAVSRAGVGATSGPSNPAVPLGAVVMRLVAEAPKLAYGQRVVYRATLSPAPTAGTVLFAEDGKVLFGCGDARVVAGQAACAIRLTSASTHVVLATFTGDEVLSGAEADLSLRVAKAATTLRAAAAPISVEPQGTLLLHGWGLPGAASGKVVFDSGATRLCVAVVRSGGAKCSGVADLAPGVDPVTATYVGDRDYLGSSARTTVRVLPVGTT